MKKKIILALLCMFMFLCGCSSEKSEEGYNIFYKDTDYSGLTCMKCSIEADDSEELIMKMWDRMKESSFDENCISTVPDNLNLNRISIENGNLSLYFSEEYSSMDSVSELLLRAAAVKTFSQADSIETVTFFVNEKLLANASYTPLGPQKAADYIDVIGNGLSNTKKITLNIYFTDKNNEKLVKESQEVVYENSYAVEKDVINRLIKGPSDSRMQRTLPKNLKLISTSVKDKICYVNFDSVFLTDALSIDGNLIIYSIVNSLTELADIQKVQIMVNGDNNVVFKGISLKEPLKRNLNY